MPKVMLSVAGYRCERCKHEWVPRFEAEPRVCPKCKSPYWDTKRAAAQAANSRTGAGFAE